MKSEGIDVTQQPAHVLRRVKRKLKQPLPRRQQRQKPIDYFPIPHNTLCLPPKFCITYCLKMLLGKCNTPRSI